MYTEYVGLNKHNKDALQLFEYFYNLLKDFEMCPQLISKSMAYVLYISQIRHQNEGQLFSYDDFIRSISLIAEISQRKLSNSEELSGL